jgi:hypothetical protein
MRADGNQLRCTEERNGRDRDGERPVRLCMRRRKGRAHVLFL